MPRLSSRSYLLITAIHSTAFLSLRRWSSLQRSTPLTIASRAIRSWSGASQRASHVVYASPGSGGRAGEGNPDRGKQQDGADRRREAAAGGQVLFGRHDRA